MISTEAFAKVNLTLEVYGVRGDGYHALRSVVAPISLSDTVEVSPAKGISCDSGFADDLCVKAAGALFRRTPSARCPLGASIHVAKRIPVGGGLGGGSADAAAVLLALNGMWGLGLSPEELAEVGAEVGSDVPALVMAQHYRASVVMEGRGETVSLVPPGARRRPPLELVLVNPGVHTSTREVYARSVARSAKGPSATGECLAALESGELGRIARSFANDLEGAALSLHPEISAAMDALRAEGAIGVAMSGSGSSAFGLAETRARAQEMALALRGRGLRAWAVHTLAQDLV